ncbi:MAG: thiol-disulfide oxidoreductase DCC family protein [Lewinellaceae bacterium]|nr:thiol-disulfide oxidoreductase DCC family protein [Lewinellaceae bacterium]
MADQTQHPVLLFDGVCNLCNASVQWILLRDKHGIFRFASLQSEQGQALLQQFGLDTETFNSVVLVDNGQLFTQSDAVLQIASQLGLPWSAARVFRILPKGLRNAVYDWVARNRYRWFGRQEQCMLPRPEWKGRFIG